MIPANSRPAALPMPKLKLLNWKVIIPIIRPTIKKGAESQQVSDLAVNGDKANAVGNGFYASRVAADLQNVAFVEHDVVVDGHLNLAADDAVKEAAVVGQLELRQTTANGVMV